MLAARQAVLTTAYQAHPERFVRGQPRPAGVPAAVWINPPVVVPLPTPALFALSLERTARFSRPWRPCPGGTAARPWTRAPGPAILGRPNQRQGQINAPLRKLRTESVSQVLTHSGGRICPKGIDTFREPTLPSPVVLSGTHTPAAKAERRGAFLAYKRPSLRRS